MSGMGGAAVERLRLTLVVVIAGTSALLFLSLLTQAASAPSVVVLAAVAATMAAVVGSNRMSPTPMSSPLGLPLGSSDQLPALGAGHVTDSPRHPLRPRAPGLV